MEGGEELTSNTKEKSNAPDKKEQYRQFGEKVKNLISEKKAKAFIDARTNFDVIVGLDGKHKIVIKNEGYDDGGIWQRNIVRDGCKTSPIYISKLL